MAIYLFSQILKFTYNINLIEKLSIRYLINSSDVFVIKGFTVFYPENICVLRIQRYVCHVHRVIKRRSEA